MSTSFLSNSATLIGWSTVASLIATAYTEWRAEFAQQFIDNTPEGNIDAAKYVLNTKPIAQHAAYGSDFITTLTAVMDTKKGCMEVAPGVSEWNNFQEVCFNKQ